MKLTDLDATFIKLKSDSSFQRIDSIAEAQGILFVCPKCQSHSVICWFQGVPDHVFPKPGRWTPGGTGLEDLTLKPSVFLNSGSGCGWHGFVTNGDAA
jgi:hypothetical protein